MEYGILGPVEVRDLGGAELKLGGAIQQRILATLILDANRSVSLGRLAEAAWGADAPTNARRLVQNRVGALRTVLAAAGAADAIITTSQGYRLAAAPEQVDSSVFTGLCREAEEVADPSAFRRALALWRGPALGGLGGAVLGQAAVALEEKQLNAYERCIELELAAASHHQVIPELATLVAAHPLRERLVALLMTALYRAGRPGEALAAYRDLAQRLAHEQGLDPSAELQHLHRQVLRADVPGPTPAVPRRASSPWTRANFLPRPIPDFTGRTDLVTTLLTLADSDSGADVILLDGMAGSGKTTVAVRVAHLLAGKYADGWLYVDLHGHSEREPIDTGAALDSLLRQLGVPTELIPDELDERVAMWRAELSGRRALILLDNAADDSQVLPLISGERRSLTLVTSRKRLTGIDGAAAVSVEVLSEPDAVALLSRIVGERVRAATELARELARLCGYLPLALRVAGARLASRPRWSLEDLVTQLRQARPLVELILQGRSVEAAFKLSYNQLGETEKLVFRRLGLHPVGNFGEHAAAAMAGLPLAETRGVLEDLADGNLLETPHPGRYRLHDLLRDYAGTLVATETSAHRDEVLKAMCDYYLQATASATGWLERAGSRPGFVLDEPPAALPSFTSADEAKAWLGVERANILAVIRLAYQAGWYRRVCLLARAMWIHLFSEFSRDLIELQELSLRAATALGDATMIASAHNYVASIYWRQGNYNECLRHAERALQLRRALGDPHEVATSLLNLGMLASRMGDFSKAVQHVQESMSLWIDLGVPEGIGCCYTGLGMANGMTGQYEEGLRDLQKSLLINRKVGKPIELANSIIELGALRLRMGQYRLAALHLTHAFRTKKSFNDRYGEAEALSRLGCAYRGLAQPLRAEDHQRKALAAMVETGIRGGECMVLNDLAMTLAAMGRRSEAVELHQRALRLATQIADRPEQARAYRGLGDIIAGSDSKAARKHWLAARELFAEMGMPERHAVAQSLAGLGQGQLTHSSVPSANT